jgi:Dyp-type peroxidase family
MNYLSKGQRDIVEKQFRSEKRKQQGVAFPSASEQEHILIIRFDISRNLSDDKDSNKKSVRQGLQSLCGLFDLIDQGVQKIDELQPNGNIEPVELAKFNFSFTIGFGISFFEKLDIIAKNRPRTLTSMPSNQELGDITPYALHQTDFIIQLGSQVDYVNRWVYQNSTDRIKMEDKTNVNANPKFPLTAKSMRIRSPDILTALKGWANITDIHSGFQRIDGRNLLGFNDGISNPDRLSNDVIWTTVKDEDIRFKDSTYMVFQKIEHDLEKWQSMEVEKQEKWIGRSKATGLLLGTMTKDQDRKLASEMRSNNPSIRLPALKKWKKLYREQQDPTKRFFDMRNIRLECPVWSHVRKANPRGADGVARSLIFRRGYPYIDTDPRGKSSSGLLFICYQRNIEKGFENIKKNFLNNKDFPIPKVRKRFNREEIISMKTNSRLVQNVLKNPTVVSHKILPSVSSARSSDVYKTLNNAIQADGQDTGREGLAGPSELDVFPGGQFSVITTIGGGYYFVPPVPKTGISDISEQFFS